MKIIKTVKEMNELTKSWHGEGLSVGLVPTMGYLHDGHLSLIKAARAENDRVVVSVFVNPTQFGPNEDYDRYPRDMEADSRACEEAGVDAIFAPEPAEMYPPHFVTYVEPTELETRLCGVTRPIHFRGVCTVVLKLFNIVCPTNAYFGQKDAQQYLILARMVRDLNMDDKLTLHRMPIVREEDGLARSSRNVYLNEEERKQALCLSRAVAAAERLYAAGEKDAAKILAEMKAEIDKAPLAKIDYLTIVDTVELLPVDKLDKPVLAAMAVYFGSTRLIDNTILGE
ncbi:MAG: pantoate--beta-alanine ligase [Firmicutes bacterium]|nr:pantoate--beta-alanine ligase [Bacillota bacterium]